MDIDRLPMIEWAGWWDKTITRWLGEGLRSDMDWQAYREYLGLDMLRQVWIPMGGPTEAVTGIDSYLRQRDRFYNYNVIEDIAPTLRVLKKMQEENDCVFWFTLSGYFWFPRGLMGIERHLYCFYDDPELMHMINNDLCNWQAAVIDRLCDIISPEFMTFGEDMSYNHGPMLSRDTFNEFLLPYYKRVAPMLKDRGVKVMVDTDGDLTRMIPWLIEAGIEGALPLERQAGVDAADIRKNFPEFFIIGHYDKMVMKFGENAMRAEFERLLPTMRKGGFIPSVDHQTPPDVSLENYRVYVDLLREYTKRAAE